MSDVSWQVELATDVIALAVDDLRRGPGRSFRQQRNYQTARTFLMQAGLLDRVVAAHGLELEEPPVEQLELLEFMHN